METATQYVNGVNVDQLVRTINLTTEDSSLALFHFRAHCDWVEGGCARTRIQGFFGAGAEDIFRTAPFVLEGDEPPVLLGSNAGPNAVEVVLHALASCLSVGFIYNAAARGVRVQKLEFDMEGDVDLHGFLGLSDEVRPGYREIRVQYHVESDPPRETIEEICEHVRKTSPVLDLLRNPVPVSIELAGM